MGSGSICTTSLQTGVGAPTLFATAQVADAVEDYKSDLTLIADGGFKNPGDLPKAFDGYTILHLSDLHLDGMKNLEERILNILSDQTVDLCVLTGDYRTELHGLHKHIIEFFQLDISIFQ